MRFRVLKSGRLLVQCMLLSFASKGIFSLGIAWVSVLLLWIGSIWIEVHFQTPDGRYFGFISDGRISLCHQPVSSPGFPLSLNISNTMANMEWWFGWDRLGPFWGVDIPLWIAVLAIGLILVFFVVRRATRQPASSSCPDCGYSLEGLLSEVCPECGGAVKRRHRD